MSVLQEVSLIGSIHKTKKDSLIERLKAISTEDTKFLMMETAYKYATSTTANETTYSELRLRRFENSHQETLATVGVPHIDNSNPNQPVCVKGITEAAVWQNPAPFLRSVGYIQEFDFTKEGQMFLHPKNVIIYVYQVKRRKTLHPLFETSWLVEVVSVSNEMKLEEVRFVAKQLSQLVSLKAISQKDLYEERQKREKEMMK